MKKYLFLLTLFGCFTMASCTKDSSIHVNKFTCKVNGVFWEAIPRERDILGNDLQMDKSPVFEVSFLLARNTKKSQSINFTVPLYDTARISNVRDSNPFADYTRNCNVYYLDTLSPHTVTVIDHDKAKRIVKGTFIFRAINRDAGCTDTATVTNGSFDMHY
jgi:hypothetical protein